MKNFFSSPMKGACLSLLNVRRFNAAMLNASSGGAVEQRVGKRAVSVRQQEPCRVNAREGANRFI